MGRREKGGYQRLKVDEAIIDTDKVICRNISVFDASTYVIMRLS